MNRFLTKQEQGVICLVITLVLVGLAVKAYKTSHPAPVLAQQAESPK